MDKLLIEPWIQGVEIFIVLSFLSILLALPSLVQIPSFVESENIQNYFSITLIAIGILMFVIWGFASIVELISPKKYETPPTLTPTASYLTLNGVFYSQQEVKMRRMLIYINITIMGIIFLTIGVIWRFN